MTTTTALTDPDTINLDPENMEQVRILIGEYVSALGFGFHPDTPFAEYVYMSGDEQVPMFTEDQAQRLDEQLGECFRICQEQGEDIYAIGLAAMAP